MSAVRRSHALSFYYSSQVSHYMCNTIFKDGRAKLFQLIDFFKFFLQSDNELNVKKITNFISEIKRVENYSNSDFEKLVQLIQHGLRGFRVKNIECEAMEANDLSHILYNWVCYVNN